MKSTEKKSYSGGAAFFRFLSLEDDVSKNLQISQPVECCNGVFITIGSYKGDALMEIVSSEIKPVLINGNAVIDVAHFKAGDNLMIKDKSYVVLKPLQIYVPERKMENDKLARLARFISKEELDSYIASQKSKPPQKINIASRAVEKKIVDISDKLPKRKRRNSNKTGSHIHNNKLRISLGIIISLLLITVIISLVYLKANYKPKIKSTKIINIPEKNKTIVNKSVKEVITKKEKKNVPVNISKKNVLPIKEKITTIKPTPVKKLTKKINNASKKLTEVSRKLPNKARIKKHRIKKVLAKKPSIKKARKKAKKFNLKPYWEKYNEYMLESGFDPDGVKSKLKILLYKIPKSSNLAKKIKNDIKKL